MQTVLAIILTMGLWTGPQALHSERAEEAYALQQMSQGPQEPQGLVSPEGYDCQGVDNGTDTCCEAGFEVTP